MTRNLAELKVISKTYSLCLFLGSDLLLETIGVLLSPLKDGLRDLRKLLLLLIGLAHDIPCKIAEIIITSTEYR